jgi:cardiolipin synthase
LLGVRATTRTPRRTAARRASSEFQAALLHAKTMVVDGTWATIGSTNFDNRSFAVNDELNLVV